MLYLEASALSCLARSDTLEPRRMRRVFTAILAGVLCWAGWHFISNDGASHRHDTPTHSSRAGDSHARSENPGEFARGVDDGPGGSSKREATWRGVLLSDIDQLLDEMTGLDPWQAVVSGRSLLRHLARGGAILSDQQQVRLWNLALPGGNAQLGAISLNILWRANASKESVFERLIDLLTTERQRVAPDADGMRLLGELGIRDGRRDAIIHRALRIRSAPGSAQVTAFCIAADQLNEADFRCGEVVDALTAGLTSNENIVVMESMRALNAGRVWTRSIQEQMYRLVGNGASPISHAAIEALCAYVEDEADQPEWVRRYLTFESAGARAAVLRGLGRGRLWNQAIAGHVGARLMDEDVEVRLEAMRCIVARRGADAVLDGMASRFVEQAWTRERAEERWEGADAYETKCAIEYLLNQRWSNPSIREAAEGVAWDAVGEDVARGLATLLYWKSGGECGRALERLMEIVERTEPYWLESVAAMVRRLVEDQAAALRSEDVGTYVEGVPRLVHDTVRVVWTRHPIAATRLRGALVNRTDAADAIGRLLTSD